jgi:hypothetical protein
VKKVTNEPPAIRSVPRDGSRLGLPVGTLEVARQQRAMNDLLLVAAALLLVAAAFGSLALGVAVRDMARHA